MGDLYKDAGFQAYIRRRTVETLRFIQLFLRKADCQLLNPGQGLHVLTSASNSWLKVGIRGEVHPPLLSAERNTPIRLLEMRSTKDVFERKLITVDIKHLDQRRNPQK